MKNKLAPPFRTAEFDVMYGTGISRTGELLDIAVKLEIVQKAGAWFSYNGERIGQGRDNSKEFLAHPSRDCRRNRGQGAGERGPALR